MNYYYSCSYVRSYVYIAIRFCIFYIGSFSNVSAYDPAKTCPGVTISTPTTTTHSVLPDSTGAPNHAHWSNSRDIAIEFGVPLIVLAILIAVVVCVSYRRYPIHACSYCRSYTCT